MEQAYPATRVRLMADIPEQQPSGAVEPVLRQTGQDKTGQDKE